MGFVQQSLGAQGRSRAGPQGRNRVGPQGRNRVQALVGPDRTRTLQAAFGTDPRRISSGKAWAGAMPVRARPGWRDAGPGQTWLAQCLRAWRFRRDHRPHPAHD